MPKVFISYSHDSDDHRQCILNLSDRLREDGIDCYIDQYINGTPPEGWQRWMEKQIETADFVLVICTEIYLKRFKGEDRLGGRGVNFEGALISQTLYNNFQQNTKFYPLIPDQGTINHIPLTLKSGSPYKLNEDYESIYRVLTDQPRAIAKPLGKMKHYPSVQAPVQTRKTAAPIALESETEPQQHPDPVEIISTQTIKPPSNHIPFYVPYESKGKGAIGIDEILDTVHQTITNSKKTTIGQGASFQGIGGLGKTQLAVEYAHRYRDHYDGVVWLTVDQNIETQLVDLAEKTKWVNRDVDAKAKMDLAKTRYAALSDALLIYDNVDNYDEIKSLFPQSTNHILLTSRNEVKGFKSVPLNTLDEENSLKLLAHESSRDIEENELVAAKKLVEKFDGLPLALEMAGAYVDHLEISWNDYLALFKAKGLSFVDQMEIRGSTNHESNIRNTLSLSDELLAATDNIENIINLLAYGANEAIDRELMSKMLNVDEVELIEPIAIALKLKIVKKEEDGYILHRLVRDVWKEQRPLDLFFAETLASHLAAYMKSIQEEFLHLRKIDRASLQALKWVEKIENVDTKAKLLGSSAFPDHYMGRYRNGLVYIDYALTLLNLNHDSSTLSDVYTYKGVLTQSLGDYKEAELYFRKSLAMVLRVYPDQDHPDVAISLINMGFALKSLGDIRSAKPHYQQALEMMLRLYPDQNHPNVATTLNNMGAILKSLGDVKGAEPYFRQALKMRDLLYPKQDHPDVATSLNNMGFILKSLGDNKAAKSYYQQALEMRRQLYPGQDHPDIALSLNNLAWLLMESKQCMKTEALFSESLRMYQNLGIEPIRQSSIKEALKKIRKNIKRQKKPGIKKGRYCKDV